jgi:hypothetical protein
MTYSESAQGITITHKRAMRELEKHYLLSEREEFHADLGKKAEYKASDVLAWLGY